jgi:predicted nucleic acid-binding Zn ribbon protein
MPLFDYHCNICSRTREVLIMHGEVPQCCNASMRRLPSSLAMVKMKGEGGYPSRQHQFKGTAPYTSGKI